MTMKHNEKERVIQIMTYEKEEDGGPDRDFTVKLGHETDATLIHGKATVEIIDSEGPGVLGFMSEVVEVSPRDEHIKVKVRRSLGANGEVSCLIVASTLHDKLRNKWTCDFAAQSPMYEFQEEVYFADCQTEVEVIVPLPPRHLALFKPTYFALELTEPAKCRLTRRQHCLVKIVLTKRDLLQDQR